MLYFLKAIKPDIVFKNKFKPKIARDHKVDSASSRFVGATQGNLVSNKNNKTTNKINYKLKEKKSCFFCFFFPFLVTR